MSSPRSRPRIGDVVRVRSGDRAADAQFTHKHKEFGYLLRVLGPADAAADAITLAARTTQFLAFFPLGSALNRGIAVRLGTAPIPAELAEFPRFRQALRLDPVSTAPCDWLIWDGTEEWVVPALSPEQATYSLRHIINDELLVDRAWSGWTPQTVR